MRSKASLRVLFVGLAVGLGLYFSIKTWKVYQVQRSKADFWQKELKAAEQERSELLKKKALYEGPLGREELARERGYKNPNEVPLENPK